MARTTPKSLAGSAAAAAKKVIGRAAGAKGGTPAPAPAKTVKKPSRTTPSANGTATKAGLTATRKAPATKKAAAKKAPATKAAAKKAPATKATATKKVAAKKAPATKATATKKVAVKKAPAAKVAAKKAPATKAVAKKATATKKVAVKKAPATTSTQKTTAKTAPAAKKIPAKTTPLATKATSKTTSVKKVPVAKTAPAKKSVKVAANGVAPAAPRTKKALVGSLVVKEGEESWTKAELDEVIAELHGQHDKLAHVIQDAEAELAGLMKDAGDGAGHDHADMGATSFERDHELTVVNIERDMVAQIDKALARIDDGTYGVCEACGEPIGKMRLMAFPRATLCLPCKQREERR